MNVVQIVGSLGSLAFGLCWCRVLRAAVRAGPGWTWGTYGSPFRFDRDETVVLASANVIASLVFAVAMWVIFAR
jgi:hypothetical protein